MNTTQFQDFFQPSTQEENNRLLFNPDMIDDWLADELCQSGLLINLFNEPKLEELPTTPPISPSSTLSTSSTTPKTSSISLFPEIQPKKKLLLPKVSTTPTATGTINTLPRIAPRPVTIQQQQQLPIVKKPIASPTASVKAQKRPLTEKEQDEIILKRQKNTDAARRSRMKKLMKMEQLESKVNELESENHTLVTRIAVLESEKYGLESKSTSYEERIKVLEAQLAEAHRALTKIH
jgi:hypothetical protein